MMLYMHFMSSCATLILFMVHFLNKIGEGRWAYLDICSLILRPPRPTFVACSMKSGCCKQQKLGMEAWE